jgi:hypothetical protein
MSGCVNLDHQPDLKLDDFPTINPLPFAHSKNITIAPSDITVLPFISPTFRGRDKLINIMPETQSLGNISMASSQIAITLWNASNSVIVVNSYECALQASSIAHIKNIPILFYGNTTMRTIHLLNCSEVICIGGVLIEESENIKLTYINNQKDVWEYAIRSAKEKGFVINYLAVANPCDEESLCLSAFSSVVAAHRNGIVITSREKEFKEINATIQHAMRVLNENNMSAEYVCLFGGHGSVPFFLKPIPYKYDSTLFPDGNIATDNYYGDTDGNTFIPEIAVGRFLQEV